MSLLEVLMNFLNNQDFMESPMVLNINGHGTAIYCSGCSIGGFSQSCNFDVLKDFG